MMLRGWYPETLETGDAVVVTGNPGRSATRRIVLGRSLVHDGTTMVLNVEPNSPPPDTSVTDEDRTGTPPAEALLGTWLPQVQAFSIFLAPEPRLTDSAQAALRAGTLRHMEPEPGAASCLAHRPPLNMTFQEPKRFESRGNDIVIRVVVDGDVERIVHMNGALGDGGAPGRQGYSVGRWENDALIVETTFDANEGEGRGLFDGIPLAGTLLVER